MAALDEVLSEEEWINKLKLLDEQHSKTFSLTPSTFNLLADQIMDSIVSRTPKTYGREYVLQCLKENDNCTVKCEHEISLYVNNVNKSQLRKLRDNYEKFKKDEAQQKKEEPPSKK